MWCTHSETVNGCNQYGVNLIWMLDMCSLPVICLADLSWMFVARDQRERWS